MKATQVEVYPSNPFELHTCFCQHRQHMDGGDSRLNPEGSSFTLLKLYILLCSEMRNFLANKKQFLSGLKTVFLLVLCRAWSQRRELNPRNFLQSPLHQVCIILLSRETFFCKRSMHLVFWNTSPLFFLLSFFFVLWYPPSITVIYIYNLGSAVLCTTNDDD